MNLLHDWESSHSFQEKYLPLKWMGKSFLVEEIHANIGIAIPRTYYRTEVIDIYTELHVHTPEFWKFWEGRKHVAHLPVEQVVERVTSTQKLYL